MEESLSLLLLLNKTKKKTTGIIKNPPRCVRKRNFLLSPSGAVPFLYVFGEGSLLAQFLILYYIIPL